MPEGEISGGMENHKGVGILPEITAQDSPTIRLPGGICKVFFTIYTP